MSSWWTDANNNQSVIDRMVSRSIRGLTNQKSDAEAWSSIFRYYNRFHGRCKAVHEHWNNGTDKKYSRNLGKAHGIELFQV